MCYNTLTFVSCLCIGAFAHHLHRARASGAVFRQVTASGQQQARRENGIIERMGEMEFKIVSGGQTGIDQAALAAAQEAGVVIGSAFSTPKRDQVPLER